MTTLLFCSSHSVPIYGIFISVWNLLENTSLFHSFGWLRSNSISPFSSTAFFLLWVFVGAQFFSRSWFLVMSSFGLFYSGCLCFLLYTAVPHLIDGCYWCLIFCLTFAFSLVQFFAEYNSKLLESTNYITRRQAVKVMIS